MSKKKYIKFTKNNKESKIFSVLVIPNVVYNYVWYEKRNGQKF